MSERKFSNSSEARLLCCKPLLTNDRALETLQRHVANRTNFVALTTKAPAALANRLAYRLRDVAVGPAIKEKAHVVVRRIRSAVEA